MSAIAIELATAYVSIVPSTNKIAPAVKRALRDIQADADRHPVDVKVKTSTDNDSLSRTTRALGGIGKSAGGVSAAGAAMAALGGAAGLAGGAVGTLSLGMAALGGVAATGIATATVGLQGMGDAVKAINDGDPEKIAESISKLAPSAREAATAFAALKPQLSAVQQAVQGQLFEGLAGPLTNLANVTLPTVSTGMQSVAGAMNQAAKGAAGFLASAEAQQGIQAAFQSTTTLISSATAGLGDLGRGVFDLIGAAQPAMAGIGAGLSSVFSNLGVKLSELVPCQATFGR